MLMLRETVDPITGEVMATTVAAVHGRYGIVYRYHLRSRTDVTAPSKALTVVGVRPVGLLALFHEKRKARIGATAAPSTSSRASSPQRCQRPILH
jgi:hypothetical protein